MFETLALAELDRIEKILAGGKTTGDAETTGDAVDDVVLLGGSKPRITIGDKHYLKAGVSAPLTDFPKYSGINQSTDYTKDTAWNMMRYTAVSVGGSPKGIIQDSEGTYWKLGSNTLTLGPTWYLQYSTDLKTWATTTLGNSLYWGSPYDTKVLDWLVVGNAILLLDTKGSLIYNRTPKDPTGWRRLDYVAALYGGSVISTDTRMAWFRGSDLVCFMSDTGAILRAYKANDLLNRNPAMVAVVGYTSSTTNTVNNSSLQLLACSDGMTGYRLCLSQSCFFQTLDGGRSWHSMNSGTNSWPSVSELSSGQWGVVGTTIFLLYGGKFFYRTTEMSAWASYVTDQYKRLDMVVPLNERWLIRYWKVSTPTDDSWPELDYIPVDKIGTSTRPWGINPPTPWGGKMYIFRLSSTVYDNRGELVWMGVYADNKASNENYGLVPPKNCIHLPKTTEYQYLRVS